MWKKNLLLAAALCSANVACTLQREAGTNVTEVGVQYYETALKASSVLQNEERQAIRFDATDSANFYSYVNRLIFADDRTFLVDEPTDRIIAFDKGGNFLASTARLIGRGHNEYVSLLDATADTAARRLYACCDSPLSFLEMDYDLRVIRVIPTEYFLKEIVSDEHFIYGLALYQSDEVKAELLVFDKQDLSAKPKTLLSTRKGVAGLLTVGNMLTYGKDGVLACLPYDDSIVKIKDGEIVGTYHIDFGTRKLDSDVAAQATAQEVINDYSDKNWIIVNACESDSSLLFNTNTGYAFVLDKRKDLCRAYRRLDNDLTRYFGPQMVSAQGLSDHVVYRSAVTERMKPIQALRMFRF